MPLSPVDWSDLRYFLALLREGSLSGAGRVLGVHASTVSRRLESMEEGLGARLFKRSQSGFSPTDVGLRIVDPAQTVERKMLLIGDLLSGESSKVEGTVRISMTPDLEQIFFADHVFELREQHPDLRLSVLSDVRLVDLISGDADIAIRYASCTEPAPVPPSQADAIQTRRLGDIYSHLYTSKRYLERTGLTVDSPPSAFDFVVPNEARRPGAVWVQKNVPPERVVGYSGNFTATIRLLESGLGAAALPRFVAAASDELVQLRNPTYITRRATWLLWPKDLNNIARVRAVLDFVVDLHARHRAYFSGEFHSAND